MLGTYAAWSREMVKDQVTEGLNDRIKILMKVAE
jgi:hypothetical protein